jgi:hypothetical protein
VWRLNICVLCVVAQPGPVADLPSSDIWPLSSPPSPLLLCSGHSSTPWTTQVSGMEHAGPYRVPHISSDADASAEAASAVGSGRDNFHDDGDDTFDTRPSKVARTHRLGYHGASATQAHPTRNPEGNVQSLSPSSSTGNIIVEPQTSTQSQAPAQAQALGPSQPQALAHSQVVRTRGVTACQICRSRKTKCDNRRPTCGYCSKIGGTCIYLDAEVQQPT